MNIIEKQLQQIALAGALFAFAASVAQAALVIAKDDINDNQYVYSLKGTSDTEFNTKFFADIYGQDGDGISGKPLQAVTGSFSYIRPETQADRTWAEFVYKFDFSSAGYQINAATFNYNVVHFNAASTITTVSYSTDNINWTTLSQKTGNSPITSNYTGMAADPSIIQGASIVYYRVRFELDPAGNDTYLPFDKAQWGRSAPDATAFSATFDLTAIPVPEPATSALILGAVVLGILFLTKGNLLFINKK